MRHAAVEAPPGLCYGATDFGAEAASTLAAAAAVAPLLPSDIALYTSPLRRCTALARAVGALRPDLGDATVDARLGEMDFGQWEQRPWDAIPRAEFDAWTADFADSHAGGSGESTRLFMARVGSAWDGWHASKRDALWITHAGVIRAVWLLAKGVRCPASAADWPAEEIRLGEWVGVEA